MKLSICTETLFPNLEICKALGKVKDAGYTAFEFWGWWNKDVDAILAEKNRLGLDLALFCTKFTSLVDPAQHASYIEGLRESIAVAKKLGARQMVTQSGADTGASREQQRAAMIEGLKQAAPLLEKAGIPLLLEPLNKRDHADCSLETAQESFEILEAVGSPQIGLLFDVYHQQITEGDIITNIKACFSQIRHFHAAGNPGRNELNRGELNYPQIMRAIESLGYTGYMGLEYYAKDPTEAGLAYALNAAGAQ